MKRFYQILCIACAVFAVFCIPFRPLWFGLAFFTALSVCSGAMWLLYHVRGQQDNPYAKAANWLVHIGNTVFVLWLLSVAAVEGLILSGAHTDPHALQADVVFVLGGGINGDQPTQTLRNRLSTALDVMQDNPDCTVIVCGGQGADEEYPEALVMYNWMVEQGADPDRILQEPESHNTIENIENAMEICEQNGISIEHTAVVSSEFHLFRTRHIMRQSGLTPAVIAAPSGNPAMRVLFCIREYFSIVKLIVTGYW